ncbi:CoA ester lyase [Xylophilus sp. Kf1]|nr:CoA ester lyase [Xylophilus sp. Kf1]
MSGSLADARSLLFVPADRPERHAKALASGADRVIVDLEDAVAPDAKPAARQALAQSLAGLSAADRQRLLVRINAQDTAWFADDLAFIAGLAGPAGGGPGGLMVPKVEGAALLAAVAAACPGLPLVPQIETGAGLDALDDIARGDAVARLCLGHLDLQNDLGIRCGPDESEIAPARWDLVRASRRHGLPPPVDSVTTDTRDPSVIDRDAARALRQGFGAKLCIHPAQVARVHAAFTPEPQQVDWARRVLAAVEASGGGVCTVDGRMVDTPVIVTAQRVLARSPRTA